MTTEILATVANGKYTVIMSDDDGLSLSRLSALRHGEPWRDCCGDGLILALAQRVQELEAEQFRCNICGGVVAFDGTPPKDLPGRFGGRQAQAVDMKSHATSFFHYWWNQPGHNTEQGYDDWVKAGCPDA